MQQKINHVQLREGGRVVFMMILSENVLPGPKNLEPISEQT